MSKCVNIPEILKQLKNQKSSIPSNRLDGYNYIKRSLELMEEGMEGTVVYDKKGAIAAAAAYYKEGKGFRIETLGSIGDFDGLFTPGMTALYNIYKETQYSDFVKVHSLPGKPALFYEKFNFVGSEKDALEMTALPKNYINYVKWYEDAAGISTQND